MDASPTPPQPATADDLDLLLSVLPPALRRAVEARPDRGDLVELVLDLGRPPELRYPERGEDLAPEPVTREDIAFVVGRVGQFGKDNRAGIERTLHRISGIRNRRGEVIGLTCRVGRAVFGTVDILRDVIEAGRSILLLGRPGVGKTTLLREAARVLADDLGKRVIVVDTSNEIAGDGDIPHPGIGRARRMQVPSPDEQHGVMIEAVENHMPEVIVIDEIGTAAEAMAARTIAERGVQLIATAHGNSLENLLQNPTLSDLVGGIQVVTLSDEEARRRGTQKTVLERKAPPTFGVLVEIQDKNTLAVHHDVAEVVDRFLREVPPRPELRVRTEAGTVEIRPSPPRPAAERSRASTLSGPPEPRRAGRGRARSPWEAATETLILAPDPEDWQRPAGSPAPRGGRLAPAAAGAEPPRRRRKVTRLFAYAVSKDKLERAMRKLRVPAVLVEDLDEADLVVTLKAQERRQPRKLRDAETKGTPVHVLKSNTTVQMENFLRAQFEVGDLRAEDEAALREVEEAIDAVLETAEPVELAPRNNYLRRLQHQAVERFGLASSSKGEEPYRRVVVQPG